MNTSVTWERGVSSQPCEGIRSHGSGPGPVHAVVSNKGLSDWVCVWEIHEAMCIPRLCEEREDGSGGKLGDSLEGMTRGVFRSAEDSPKGEVLGGVEGVDDSSCSDRLEIQPSRHRVREDGDDTRLVQLSANRRSDASCSASSANREYRGCNE